MAAALVSASPRVQVMAVLLPDPLLAGGCVGVNPISTPLCFRKKFIRKPYTEAWYTIDHFFRAGDWPDKISKEAITIYFTLDFTMRKKQMAPIDRHTPKFHFANVGYWFGALFDDG